MLVFGGMGYQVLDDVLTEDSFIPYSNEVLPFGSLSASLEPDDEWSQHFPVRPSSTNDGLQYYFGSESVMPVIDHQSTSLARCHRSVDLRRVHLWRHRRRAEPERPGLPLDLRLEPDLQGGRQPDSTRPADLGTGTADVLDMLAVADEGCTCMADVNDDAVVDVWTCCWSFRNGTLLCFTDAQPSMIAANWKSLSVMPPASCVERLMVTVRVHKDVRMVIGASAASARVRDMDCRKSPQSNARCSTGSRSKVIQPGIRPVWFRLQHHQVSHLIMLRVTDQRHAEFEGRQVDRGSALGWKVGHQQPVVITRAPGSSCLRREHLEGRPVPLGSRWARTSCRISPYRRPETTQ